MNTYETPRGLSSEFPGHNSLEARKLEIERKINEAGTAVYFSGSGSGRRLNIFIAPEDSGLKPLPHSDVPIIEHDFDVAPVYGMPDLKWAVTNPSTDRTYFEDSNGEIGVRYLKDGLDTRTMREVTQDVFDYTDKAITIAELEEQLRDVFSGEPLRSDLHVGAAFETVPLVEDYEEPVLF